jgi:hypothetical protein
MKRNLSYNGLLPLMAAAALFSVFTPAWAQDKKPNIVMLMTDDTGCNDFGYYDSTK